MKLSLEQKSPIDMRGNNRPVNAKPGTVIDKIMEHIASFSTKISYYSSKEHQYFNEKLNVLCSNYFSEKITNYTSNFLENI